MPKYETVPNTRSARITESDAGKAARQTKMSTPGTGQHVTFQGDSSTPQAKGASIGRTNDRPMKGASYPSTAADRDGKSGSAQVQSKDFSQRVTTAPDVPMPSFQMQKDSGPKTGRERDFADWMSSAKSALDGAQERDFYPTPLERGTQAEIAKGDKYAGTANKVTKPNRQAQ